MTASWPAQTLQQAIHKEPFNLSLILVSNLCCRISLFPVLSDVQLLNTSPRWSSSESQSPIQFNAAPTAPTPAFGASEGQGGN